MNKLLKVVGGVLILDHVGSALNFAFSDYKRERGGHTFSVVGVDGKIHDHVLVNHRGRMLSPLPKTGEIDSRVLYTLAREEIMGKPRVDSLDPEDVLIEMQCRQTQIDSPLKEGTLLQMNSHPDYVYDPRLGYREQPNFHDGNFSPLDMRRWESYGMFKMSMLHWAVSLITRQ